MWKALLVSSPILLAGCGDPDLVALPTLKVELKNPGYRWDGPCSREERIPKLHAARALAYWGDPAVPILLDALEDPDIDIYSVEDALSEIGIPVHLYYPQIWKRDSGPVRRWWADHRMDTIGERSRHRAEIGLPPIR